jgi:hypothetical protein
MVRKRALERWETKLANCEVTPQAIWSIAKSLIKRGGPKAPSAIHGSLCPTFYPINYSVYNNDYKTIFLSFQKSSKHSN